MLQTLRIRNLAIVEALEIEFGPGLNVITGETGAGKSIVAGGLGLVLGERADRSMIRSGSDTCSVEAAFHLADSSDTDAALEELGLPLCDGGALVLRRSLSASGAGRNWVNDSPTTAQALKRIGDLLVDMHGPHDHQSLLNRASQLDLLDAFGRLWKQREDYETVYDSIRDLRERIAELDCDDHAVAAQIDLLSFQIEEIERAKLDPDEETELEKEHARVANAHEIIRLSSETHAALAESESSALNAMAGAVRALTQLERFFPDAGVWLREAESAAIQIQELDSAVASHAGNVEADPARLQEIEDRMALVRDLKRKYAPTIGGILDLLERARTRLGDLQSRGERIAALNRELQAEEKKLAAAGSRLGEARRKAAASLAKTVTAELRDLGFPHGSFSVDLTPGEPRPAGMDDIEFGFAPNAGEPSRPLRLIASSGEISRVMLATKSVLAVHDRIPLLLFDEIDANVGGEMGVAIGAKLQAVANHHQIICITHLPQVAVCGTRHLVASKTVEDGRTRTAVTEVGGDVRVEEIARMLGGRSMTRTTLAHAREMLTKRA
ncbi:MAG: DNA repair protein RecN [Lentisphaerae bacterium]|nr:DNA repair protein RecN [Lentisphaerota bacterium]